MDKDTGTDSPDDGPGPSGWLEGVWRRDSRACGLKAGWTSREAQVDDPGTGPGRSRRSQGDGLDTGNWTGKEQEIPGGRPGYWTLDQEGAGDRRKCLGGQ
ncbi:unnamed protein product [Boreogadus saida]